MTESSAATSRRKKVAVLVWAGGVLVVIFLLLAAIATPKFVSFQCRSKQSEAKANLKALFVAEEAYFSKLGMYSEDFETLGFTARGSERYIFGFIAAGANDSIKVNNPSSPLAGRLSGRELRRLLTDATGGPNTFKAFAVGNIDADDALDIWTISDKNDLTNLLSDCAK
jgi:type IV pilus assembly protein PilA